MGCWCHPLCFVGMKRWHLQPSYCNLLSCFQLQVGNLPFWMGEKGKGEMLWKIVKGEYSMEESDWETVSDGAKQLVSYMVSCHCMPKLKKTIGSFCLADY